MSTYQIGGKVYPKNWLDSVFVANKNIPFVNKILSSDTTSIQIPEQDGRSTHFMESSDNIVYPTVQAINGKLSYLGNNARENAIKTKNYIQLKSDKDAIYFGENFKNSET